MALIITFPSAVAMKKMDVFVAEITENELLAEALAELQMNLDILRGYFVDMHISNSKCDTFNHTAC